MISVKRSNMIELAKYQTQLWERPSLRFLFFELTDRCNLGCKHCGSSCNIGNSAFLETGLIQKVISEVADRYDPANIMVCLTGGEPLLHKGIVEIISYAHSLGFPVGITSNGTLIDDNIANNLAKAGLDTIAISLDGIGSTHDSFRGCSGSFEKAVAGIEALIKAGLDPQVVTVVHKGNLLQLEEIYHFITGLNLYSWRLTNVDPIGRAALDKELLLNQSEYTQMLDFIREKRYEAREGMEITFGCAHFLGYEYERTVRDGYFQCAAGTQIASVMANGDIGACLDIIRRPDLVQGNIYEDDFVDIWENRFNVFRRNRVEDSSVCGACEYKDVCLGDSAHTWDYDKKKPQYCYVKGIGVR